MNNIKTEKQLQYEKKLLEYDGDDKIVLSTDLKKELEEEKKSKKLVSMISGISSLDWAVGSFDGGELNIISGQTGMGKTLLAQTLTNNFFKQGIRCLWFSYEVQPLQFLKQFGDDIPEFCMPGKLKGNSLSWLREKIYETKIKYGCDVVFLDHLHFLIDMSKGSVTVAIDQIMPAIRKIALDFDIVFFLLAHTGKLNYDSELDNNSLRNSSMIAQYADNVFFIWRKKGTEKEAILKITKNRRFGVMDKKILLIKIADYLKELENE